MRVHILGSAAGKTVPRPFCRCRVCQIARQNGGRDVRTRCAVHLHLDAGPAHEPRYGIDVSPDVPAHLIRHGLVLDRLQHLLITHAHGDHLDQTLLAIRPSILSDRSALPLLTLYGSESVGEQLLDLDMDRLNVAWQQVEPFVPFAAGELRVTPIAAHHGAGTALNFAVEHAGRSLLLAWDTGYWTEDTWERMSACRFDGVISECTIFGPSALDPAAGHMNFATLVAMKERLISIGCITDTCPWATLHIGDNGGLTYGEQRELAARENITVGFDGMWFEVPRPPPHVGPRSPGDAAGEPGRQP